eukprot:1247277-Rhodomonas_salina.3
MLGAWGKGLLGACKRCLDRNEVGCFPPWLCRHLLAARRSHRRSKNALTVRVPRHGLSVQSAPLRAA